MGRCATSQHMVSVLHIVVMCLCWGLPYELAGSNKLARMMVFSVTHNTVRQKANSPQEAVGDEEWIHHFTPTSKRSAMEWKLSGSPKKNIKVTPSAGKVLAIMLKCLWEAIRRKCVFLMKVWFSSVPMADCMRHRNLLQKFCWLMLDHPSYSPDLAPSDFHGVYTTHNTLKSVPTLPQ